MLNKILFHNKLILQSKFLIKKNMIYNCRKKIKNKSYKGYFLLLFIFTLFIF